jgi:hypothetical protein
VKPVIPKNKNRPVTPPATQGWSSGIPAPVVPVPIDKPKSKAVPSTAGVIQENVPQSQPLVPEPAPVPIPRVTPAMMKPLIPKRPVVPQPVPATGGWTSGVPTPQPVTPVPVIPNNVKPPATNIAVMPVATNVAVLPPATNIAINGPINPAEVGPTKSPPATGAWTSGHPLHQEESMSLLAGADSEVPENPDCPAPPTPDAINCKMEDNVAALDWYPEDEYGAALLTSE